jgi:hypothetical protein
MATRPNYAKNAACRLEKGEKCTAETLLAFSATAVPHFRAKAYRPESELDDVACLPLQQFKNLFGLHGLNQMKIKTGLLSALAVVVSPKPGNSHD